jgi:hypothetical protein
MVNALGMESQPTTEQWRRFIRNMSDGMVEATVEALWWAQTPDERRARQTIHDNRRGFTKEDAPILSPMAEYLVSATMDDPERHLSQAQIRLARKLLVKYVRQIQDLAHGDY